MFTPIPIPIVTIDSPDDEHLFARNMQKTGKNKYKKKYCGSSWLFTKVIEACCLLRSEAVLDDLVPSLVKTALPFSPRNQFSWTDLPLL